ncbi:FAD-binding domain-containing protein [Mytilinidion resinicola]|uniref:FAD-binding domain-containing protein n=1 Tax=Mytilinidion resinicola TaxID=574789 RepID=A0A6A6YA90_9PEZI|nr:FAD-binding domain-containing protein [Mytilinidion resinicola]KAF2805035.1 FAD-binding domain-containing protein [Mytilinidion resinicola]
MAPQLPTQHAALTAAGLSSLLLSPTSPAYAARESSYWAANARLHPSYIIQPRTTADVSRTIKALARADGNFAIRSGGHSQWAGGSNIHDGVVIDLGLMTRVTYDPETTLASIESGLRWGAVYNALDKHGVCVAGGRVADVGVGGFLTGGGNSHYTGRMGMGCDSVVNFEVVLASGDVVNANKSENPDLWRALKGGSGNFGIVTRFDMRTIPATRVWGGVIVAPRSSGMEIVEALVRFTDESEKRPEDAMIVGFTFMAAMASEVVALSVLVDTNGVPDAAAFEEIQKVPAVVKDLKIRSVEESANLYSLLVDKRVVTITLTFRNDAAIIKKVVELHDELVEDFKSLMPAEAFATQCLLQPLPTYFAQRSVEQGGNVLGLDSVLSNSILWLGQVSVDTDDQHTIAEPKIVAWKDAIEKFAIERAGNVPWRYLNYSDASQKPLTSYGADNVKFMGEVAAKYDPEGVFQRKVPGGFKLSRGQ